MISIHLMIFEPVICWKRLSRHDEWCSIDLDESLMSVTSTATRHCSRNFANTSRDRTEKVGNTEALSNNLCRRDTSQEHPIIRIAVEMKVSYRHEWICKLEWQQLISQKWSWKYWLILAPLNWRESFKGLFSWCLVPYRGGARTEWWWTRVAPVPFHFDNLSESLRCQWGDVWVGIENFFHRLYVYMHGTLHWYIIWFCKLELHDPTEVNGV